MTTNFEQRIYDELDAESRLVYLLNDCERASLLLKRVFKRLADLDLTIEDYRKVEDACHALVVEGQSIRRMASMKLDRGRHD